MASPPDRDTHESATDGPGGRFDRIDLVVMAAILLLALLTRGYRLDEPRAMYFDEVYHARTATEFLQDWRYGEPHDIYEWTHPHLAKYAMAVSIALLGNDRMIDEQDLGIGVSDAIHERPWQGDITVQPGILWVGGPDGLLGMEDGGGDVVHPITEPVTAVALDQDGHLLYVATPSGVVAIDTTGSGATNVAAMANVGDIALAGDHLVTLTDDGTVTTWSLDGVELASVIVDSAAAVSDAAEMRLVVADTADVTDPTAVAGILADITGEDSASIEERLSIDGPFAVLSVAPDDDVAEAIADRADELPGVRVETRQMVAVAATSPGDVRLLDAETLVDVSDIPLEHTATILALVPSGIEWPTLYVGGGDQVSTIAITHDGPQISEPLTLPGPVSLIAWNESANLVHVATQTDPDTGSPTIAVIEPNGFSLFADAVVPFTPTALAVVDRPDVPSDPVTIRALSADGRMATIDAGSNARAWRLPGVLAGALTVLCLYILARILSRRRSVGLAVAGLALLDGMMFATARIAMNDVYVTLCITAAVTLFAVTWTGRWRRPWVVGTALVFVGVLLGLALASKWVGLYAVGGIGLLLLSRSGLGRVIVLLGMLAATTVLGAAAIAPADVEDPSRNWTFLVLMLSITALIGAAMVRRPLPLEPNELRNAGVIGIVVGVAVSLGAVAGSVTTLALAGAVSAIAGVGAVVVARAPSLVHREAPVTDGTPTFLLPGRARALPWLFALGCIVAVPMAVYVLSYLPWVTLGNQLVTGIPQGNGGQTLLELTRSMYAYHDELRATHAASSPWWAWMLDLKPVWTYLGDMAGGLTGTIYAGGNPLILWSSIGGLAFTGISAWRYRSPTFALVMVMFLSLWLPWARIDRVTFQYHLTSSLPFALLALALLVSALWHRSSTLALTIGRVTIMCVSFLPAAIWLLRGPLCVISGISDGALCTTDGEGLRTASILALAGGLPAFLAWRSRDGRHLVVGLCLAIAVVSMALYPSLSALPIGDDLGGWVTRLLPPWDYGWQFSVNVDPPVDRSLFDLGTLIIGVVAISATVLAMAAATRWDGLSRRAAGPPAD